MSRLLKELDSENGIMEFLYDGDSLAGLKAAGETAARSSVFFIQMKPMSA